MEMHAWRVGIGVRLTMRVCALRCAQVASVMSGGNSSAASTTEAGGEQVTLAVEGMMCTKSCTPKVEAALRAVAGVEDVVVSLKEKSAVVRGVGLDAQKLVEAVGATGKVQRHLRRAR